jgi:hypothetical protein
MNNECVWADGEMKFNNIVELEGSEHNPDLYY